MEEYCRLDRNGARLSSDTADSERIAKLATWPIEPGWDSLVAIRAFELVSVTQKPKYSIVVVRYTVLGSMFGATVTPARKRTELVRFVLVPAFHGWQIQRPMIPPHVSVSTALSAMEKIGGEEKDSDQIRRLHAGIEVLKRWQRETEVGQVR